MEEKFDSTADLLWVAYANKEANILLVSGIICFNKLTLAAKKCNKFKEIWLLLLSIPQLCKSKLTMSFKGETAKISDSDRNIFIPGYLDPAQCVSHCLETKDEYTSTIL